MDANTSVTIQAYSAIAVAVCTAFYLFVTGAMWLEMRRTNNRLMQPSLQVLLAPQPPPLKFVFDLTIRNAGMIPLYNIRISVDPLDIPSFNNLTFGDLAVFRQPISVLVEREEIRFSLLDYREVVSKQKDTAVTFMITYDTALKHGLSVSYVYDLSIYRNVTVITPKS